MKRELRNSETLRRIALARSWLCDPDKVDGVAFADWLCKSPDHINAFLCVTAFDREADKILLTSAKRVRRRRIVVASTALCALTFAAAAMMMVMKEPTRPPIPADIQFAGETLAEAAAKLNRYNAQKIVIADPNLANQRISGRFPTNANEFATTLAVPFEVQPAADPRTGNIRLTRVNP